MSVGAIDDSTPFDHSRVEASSTWNGRDIRASRLDNEALFIRALAFVHLATQQESLQAVRKLEQKIYALGALETDEESTSNDIDDPEINDFLVLIESTGDWTSPEFLKAEERVKLLLNDPTRPCNPLLLHRGFFKKVAKAVRHTGRDIRHFCEEHKKPLIIAAAVVVAVTTTILTAGTAAPQALAGVIAAAAIPPSQNRKEDEKAPPPPSASSPPPPKNTKQPDFQLSVPTTSSPKNTSPPGLTPQFSTKPEFRVQDVFLPITTSPIHTQRATPDLSPPPSINILRQAPLPSFKVPSLPSYTSSTQSNFPKDLSLSMPPLPNTFNPNLFTPPACSVPSIEMPLHHNLPSYNKGFVPLDIPFPSSLSLPGPALPIPPLILSSQQPPTIPPPHQAKESPASKIVYCIDPDAPPRIYSIDPPAPPTPKVFEIPGKILARGAIGGINGMGNDFAQATKNAEYIKELSDGHQIQWVHNKTHTIAVDILEAFCVNGLGHSAPAQDLIGNWTAFHEKFKKDPSAKYFQICHSQGALHVKNALMRTPKEIRDRIIVLAIAPAVIVPKDLCFQSFNYVSKRDPIPFIGAMFQCSAEGLYQECQGADALAEFRELIFLDPHPDAPLLDHSADSPTFKKVIKDQFDVYADEYGKPK